MSWVQPWCRTTHAKHLCPLGSSAAGFATRRTLLFFSRRLNPPSQVLCGRLGRQWYRGASACGGEAPALCPLQSLSPYSSYHNDLIPAISPAPQRTIRLLTGLSPKHSQARTVTSSARCSPPPTPPGIALAHGEGRTAAISSHRADWDPLYPAQRKGFNGVQSKHW